MKKILVTGAGGFVGVHLVRALLQDKENDVYVNIYGDNQEITALLPADHILKGDLTSYGFVTRLIQAVKPTIVYHLAALAVVHDSVERAGEVLTANTLLQYNLLEALHQYAPTARTVAICSANEYGQVAPEDIPIDESTPLRPLNPYAVSKISQEYLSLQHHLAYGMDIVLLRPFNHTGPGQTDNFVIPALAKQFAEIEKGIRTPRIEVGNLKTVRDYTDVSDMVAAYLLAGEKGKSGEIYNIGTGRGVTAGELIDIFKKITGHEVEVIVNADIVRLADVPTLVCDATKFREATGWSPKIPLEETVQGVYNYWKEKIT